MTMTYDEFADKFIWLDIKAIGLDTANSGNANKAWQKFSAFIDWATKNNAIKLVKYGNDKFYFEDTNGYRVKNVPTTFNMDYRKKLINANVYQRDLKTQDFTNFYYKGVNKEYFVKKDGRLFDIRIPVSPYGNRDFVEFTPLDYKSPSYIKEHTLEKYKMQGVALPLYTFELFTSYVFYVTGQFYTTFECKVNNKKYIVGADDYNLRVLKEVY